MLTKCFTNVDIANKIAFKAKYVSDLSCNEGSLSERILKKTIKVMPDLVK